MGKGTRKKNHRVNFLPFDVSVDAPEGSRILEAVQKAALPLNTPCGGVGTCGGCIVKIAKGTFTAKSTAALSGSILSEDYVLACQTEISDDLTIVLPRFLDQTIESVVSSEFCRENKSRISGDLEHDPAVVLIEIQVAPPTLANNSSDLRRLEQAFRKEKGTKNISVPFSVLSGLARALRSENGRVHVISLRNRNEAAILDVQPRSQKKNIYGLAVDIGTTTVALHLVEMGSGEIVCTATSLNQQIKCGEDIISRINYAKKPAQLQEIQKLIIHTINNLIHTTTLRAGISKDDIYYGVFAGNTTMGHLLLMLDPRYIREEPYVPTFNEISWISASELGLSMNPEAKIYLSPAVGSYVGGDITAGMLCTPILRSSKKISLFIDAGTNGELVIGNKDWLMTCACSAGPAFEGGGIKCGMPASAGAIETIGLDEEGHVSYEVIGDIDPKGLCGSGLVDLLAELFIHGFIDRNGKFATDKIPEKIIKSDQGTAFRVVGSSESYWEKDIVITERDIANLIRTKGAVFSACSLLLKSVGLRFEEIDSLYIAGGFGQHLSVENAIRIGLLPDLERNKFHYIGNSSLSGAYLILLSDKNREMVQKIAKKMTYIELNSESGYMNEYTGSLFLPHTDMGLFPSVGKTILLTRQRK